LESLDPRRFVLSVAGQLAEVWDGYWPALGKVNLGNTAEMDAGTLLRRLVVDPLRGEDPGQQYLIVVDALDEALAAGNPSIARLPSDRLDDLPVWIRLVVSSRKDPEVLDHFSRARRYEIEVSRPENLQDVAAYLESAFSDPRCRQLLQQAGAHPEATARWV